MDTAVKLTEAALAREQSVKVENTLNHLREVLGGFEYERNPTVKFLEGYLCAMKRVMRQSDI